ncbi:MAG: hypothetical protein CVV28_02245 [Methanobacteriales archaeon HGW-Methanobacteriales-1]|nr:MAG: hypothetical protein CVV28_02245 [Methanobacteriales archaeon HGW-Methanobacteriales-1]
MFNILNMIKNILFSFFTKKEPDIDIVWPFFIELTQTEYEAHPDYNLTEEEIFELKKSDCEDRAMALAKYMIDKGFTNIRILQLSWEPDKPGHMALLYNNKVFDATASKQGKYIYFNYDHDIYIQEFKFQRIITSPYNGGN